MKVDKKRIEKRNYHKEEEEEKTIIRREKIKKHERSRESKGTDKTTRSEDLPKAKT